jgi:hypothetical protein
MNINTSKLKKFGGNLIKIRKITFPQIMNSVINTTVYSISTALKKETIPKTFTKRNNFAPMSIRYAKAVGYDMNTMSAMVGQLATAGQNNAKTLLEENELGKPIESKSKHTTIGLKNIRTGNTFSKTIKKENRLANLKPVPAEHILRNFRFKVESNNESLELKRLAGLIANNRIKTLNKPIIAHTENKIGIYKIEKTENSRVKINKLYSLKDKRTKIKKRLWLKTAYEKQLKDMDKIYIKTAKSIIDRNARAFHMAIRND